MNMTKSEAMRIASLAECDVRTVERFVAKKPVREMVAERIRRAMRKGGKKT